jgi:UDPglucose 6-dehydrogenase
MKIVVIGTGYVGLVSSICFAKIGHDVIAVDKIANKIELLKKGEIPIYEPGLKEMLSEVVDKKKISFTTDLNEALIDAKAVFIAVGTPQDENGSADLSYVLEASKEIAKYSTSSKLIVTKSTVPAKTGQKIKELVKKINPNVEFFVASNPEFLREGSAVEDFMQPDRIVIGYDDQPAKIILDEIYNFFPSSKIFHTNIITSELIKYGSNSFLATKIAFINELADLCENIGGNIKDLSKAMGQDSRIGEKFLNPGPGFGGSCFPKDILALVNTANASNTDLSLIKTVVKSNNNRKNLMVKKILRILDRDFLNKKILWLGLAFKGNTDDIRYSPSIAIIKEIAPQIATIFAHDFEAKNNALIELDDHKNIEFIDDIYHEIARCDLMVIATEWEQYRKINLAKIKELNPNLKILDLRNILDENEVKKFAFTYDFIGNKI